MSERECCDNCRAGSADCDVNPLASQYQHVTYGVAAGLIEDPPGVLRAATDDELVPLNEAAARAFQKSFQEIER